MPISLNDVDEVQEHLLGVFKRSDHHAGEVNEVLLALAGGILWRKKPGEPIKVNTKEGAGGNVIWFRVDDTRYVLLYSHEERLIRLMEGGRKGERLHTFTNATPTSEVARVFASLGRGILPPTESRKIRKEDRDPDAPKAEKPNDRKAEKLAKIQARDEKVRKKREERKAARQQAKGDTAAPQAVEDDQEALATA